MERVSFIARCRYCWFPCCSHFVSIPAQAQGQERIVHGTSDLLIARYRLTASPFFYGRPARKTRPRCCCCTGCRLPRHVRPAVRAARRSAINLVARDYPGFGHRRLARPQKIRVHVRSYRRDHESFHRSAGPHALHAVTCRITAARRLRMTWRIPESLERSL